MDELSQAESHFTPSLLQFNELGWPSFHMLHVVSSNVCIQSNYLGKREVIRLSSPSNIDFSMAHLKKAMQNNTITAFVFFKCSILI